MAKGRGLSPYRGLRSCVRRATCRGPEGIVPYLAGDRPCTTITSYVGLEIQRTCCYGDCPSGMQRSLSHYRQQPWRCKVLTRQKCVPSRTLVVYVVTSCGMAGARRTHTAGVAGDLAGTHCAFCLARRSRRIGAMRCRWRVVAGWEPDEYSAAVAMSDARSVQSSRGCAAARLRATAAEV